MPPRALLAILTLGVGCAGQISNAPDAGSDSGSNSGSDAGMPDASGTGTDGGFVVGSRISYPVMPSGSGVVLAAPNLVSVTYAVDTNAGTREALGDWMLASQWFATWRGDYGVGSGTHLAKVRLSGSPPATLDENGVGALLLGAIADGGLPSPTAATDVLYAFYLPTGINMTFLGNAVCEQVGNDFLGGYHWEAQGNGQHIDFAVVPTCSSGNLTESVGNLEFSATHEFAEACTDPFPSSNPAYIMTDPTSPWTSLGGEVGDECHHLSGQESGHTYQTIWSISSAGKGGPPCVPWFAETFYGASATPAAIQTVPAGCSLSLTIQGWSLAPVAAWTLSADSYSFGMTPALNLSADTLNNGQTATLTVGVPAAATSGTSAFVFIRSSRSATDSTFWPALIRVQ
jgi:hypothetical protein